MKYKQCEDQSIAKKGNQMTNNQLSTAPTGGLQSVLQKTEIKKRFEEVLGSRANAFSSSIISAVNANAQLKECNPMSVISAAMIAASIDLPINPSLGLSYIVPYKGSAQFQVGWKGFVQLALRSGQYKTIHATKVLEGQIKKHNSFTGEMEFTEKSTSNKAAGYLLYFKLLNGYEKYFYMTADEVQAHAKQYSAAYKKNFGVWVDNFDAMALKTVVKLGLSKYGVLSIDMQKAVEMDQAEVNDKGEANCIDGEIVDKTEKTETTAVDKLNEKIRKKKAEETKNEEPESEDAHI